MTRSRYALVAASLAAISGGAVATAVQNAAAATARPAMSAPVLKVASVKVAIGTTNKAHRLIVDSKGLAVYTLTGDSASHPKCATSTCMSFWPAVISSSKKPTVGAGVRGKVGVWHHGKINQVTLNGHPLYTFVQDSKGSALGQGKKSFGGIWYVMKPSGLSMVGSGGSSGGSGGGW